ncbi:hypothetical protein [Streptomyces sp. 8K308]|uniref:hypothetical protein n=1 Tax=Streptomyces sp. 8K308 TaxID=2530388 RepID=UPI001FB68C5D|nr:hypothetical protein [Streptomyces sp. 8K308]
MASSAHGPSSPRRLARRGFLSSAAIGGATIVGASALGALDADAAFAAPGPSLDPAVAGVFARVGLTRAFST